MQETPDTIKATVKERFAKVAQSPHEKQPFRIGPESAKTLGYDAGEIDSLPIQVSESFAGVGNTLRLGDILPGQTVLDLGSGAGMDSILAARQVGPAGRVVGVDMTDEMVSKAKRNARDVGLSNIEFRLAEIDALPVANDTVDVVVSNGVFNLCHNKPKVLAEVFRVIRPGGRLHMADILLEDGVTPQEVERKGTWSD